MSGKGLELCCVYFAFFAEQIKGFFNVGTPFKGKRTNVIAWTKAFPLHHRTRRAKIGESRLKTARRLFQEFRY